MNRIHILVFVCLLHVAILAGEVDEEIFPGWKGETYKPNHIFPHVSGEDVVKDVREGADPNSRKPWVEVVSWHPRAFVYHNFMSAEECDHIVNISKPLMRRSTVVGSGGKSTVDNIRTSYGTFIRRGKDPVVTRLERRLADWTHLPVPHQEDMQVLRYGIGQKYGAHFDSLVEQSPRVATVLIYLRDTDDGGETAFPHSREWADPAQAGRFGPFSECAKDHVAVKPKKGTALLFYSLKPDSKQQDSNSMHTGCPVLSGTKWSATKWIHTDPFHPEWMQGGLPDEPLPKPEECADVHEKCHQWAKMGECDKNQDYMLGSGFAMGHCRHACGVCEQCIAGDNACRQRNRLEAGFLPLDAD